MTAAPTLPYRTLRPLLFKGGPLKNPPVRGAFFFLPRKEISTPMTPKKEKCGLGAYAPKNPAQECTSCTFLSFEFAASANSYDYPGQTSCLPLVSAPYRMYGDLRVRCFAQSAKLVIKNIQGSIFFNRASSFALRQNVVNMDHRHSLPECSNTALAAPLCRVPARPSGYLSPARMATPDPLEWAPLIRAIREPRAARYERFEQGCSKRSYAALKLNTIPASIPLIHLPLFISFCIIKGCG